MVRGRIVRSRLASCMVVGIAVMVALSPVSVGASGPPIHQAKLTPNPADGFDIFGIALALSDDGRQAVIVGGAVGVFANTGTKWAERASFLDPLHDQAPEFGYSVAVTGDGNTMLVGAYGTNNNAEVAHVYTRSGNRWTKQVTLTLPDAMPSDVFGLAVALSSDGSTAAVTSEGGNRRAKAYIYTRAGTDWTAQATLVPNDYVNGDGFGYSVALNATGSTVIIGEPGNHAGLPSAYVFTRVGTVWMQQAKLSPSDGASSDGCGRRVAVNSNGDIALIGCARIDNGKGAAYVFTRSGSAWRQRAKLTASDGVGGVNGTDSDQFGYDVSLSGNGTLAVIGANLKHNGTGAAYLFSGGAATWSPVAEMSDPSTPFGNQGTAVALSVQGNIALVSAPQVNVVYAWILHGGDGGNQTTPFVHM